MKCILLSFLFALTCFCGFSQHFGLGQIVVQSSENSAFPESIREIRSSDLDGDGDLDVIFASAYDDKIAWFENHGEGNFSNQHIISTDANHANSVFCADLDSDGDFDVLSASEYDNKLAWYQNDGNGNFSEEQIISTTADGVQHVNAEDLDGDGDIDVISSNSDDFEITWYQNDGNGNFSEEQIITADIEAHSLYCHDLDNDGDLDIIYTSQYDDTIGWNQNDGNGNFGENQVITVDGNSIRNIHISDLDQDGDLDILSVLSTDITWYQNDGNGNFSDEEIIETSAFSPRNVFAGDLDQDGDIDLVTIGPNIKWHENDGNGSFSDWQTSNYHGTFENSSMLLDDMDNDGDLDLLHSQSGSDQIAFYKNQGNGNFGVEKLFFYSIENVIWVGALDMDGDGDNDMLSASFSDGKIAWYENDGYGNFYWQNIISNNAPGVLAIHTADLDGDGDTDILCALNNDDNSAILWYENDGNANFQQHGITSNVSEPWSVYAEDLDGDGDLDVLSASDVDNKVAWYQNDGDGNFGEQLIISNNAYQARSVHANDIDGDGDIDVISTSSNGQVAWYQNDGSGDFGDEQIISNGVLLAQWVYSTDLNGDGEVDILAGSFFEIAVYLNDGSGNINNDPLVLSESTNGFPSLFTTDLDDDGDLDILISSFIGNDITWIKNEGGGSFGPRQTISNDAQGARSVFAADLDGDGDKDIMSASEVDDKVAWYENLYGEGCTDIEACNYAPEAWIEDNSCCYSCGCTNELALNYSESHCLDDGSCHFIISGRVFHDENVNGIYDSEESTLPNQAVSLSSMGLIFLTDENGLYSFETEEQEFTINVEASDYFPFHTTTNSLNINLEETNTATFDFGFASLIPTYDLGVNLYQDGNTFLCDSNLEYNIAITNYGNTSINASIELEYDSLFQGYQEFTPIDSVFGNVVYMSFDELMPGQTRIFDITLITPLVDFIGEVINHNVNAVGYYLNEEVSNGNDSITMEITCAYDTNDKQAFPLGYTDDHWLLQETEQEFLVRFQNTGNAPVQDVRIQDTIDVNYDLSTFRFVANSHSVMTTINEETRVIDFFFEDIQLPDSVNNEPDSHGLISYAITPYADLPLGTELNNTAYIYFDNNEPIITNTTWTTIHECGGEAAFEASAEEDCVGEELSFTSSYAPLESYEWNINSVPASDEENYSQVFTESGDFIVQLVAENPLCNASTMQMVTVYDYPSSTFESSVTEICIGEEIDFTATGENVQSYEWLINDEEVSTEQSWSQTFSEAGVVELELITINEICTDSQNSTLEIFALPLAEITENGAILSAGESANYQWLLNGEAIDGATNQTYLPLEDGSYSVIVTNENNCSSQSEEVFIVNISELESPITLLYPNPMTDVAYLEFADATPRTIKLFDSAGKEVKRWDNISQDRVEILKAGLASGNYVIQVNEDGKSFSVNLVVK